LPRGAGVIWRDAIPPNLWARAGREIGSVMAGMDRKCRRVMVVSLRISMPPQVIQSAATA
jgi:hypothetical protein